VAKTSGKGHPQCCVPEISGSSQFLLGRRPTSGIDVFLEFVEKCEPKAETNEWTLFSGHVRTSEAE
jgi:hypothetical protein